MSHSVAFFVCGTPSNNDGFQLVELGPAKLPGSPRSYLDRPVNDTTESYRFEPVAMDGRRYLLYGRALRINTFDSDANRGAYLSVGCLVGTLLPMHTVANCIDIVSEVYGNMTGLLNTDRQLPVGYRLAQYAYTGTALEERLEHQCSPLLLADLMMQGLGAEGAVEWQTAKPFSFAPAELLAADVRRYQLYTAQGPLGSILSLDERRVELDESLRQTAAAAGLANELQAEWASFRQSLDDGVARLADKASAFRAITGDLERVAQLNQQLRPRTFAAGSSSAADGGADFGRQGSTHSWPAREHALARRGTLRRSVHRGSSRAPGIFGLRLDLGTLTYALVGVAVAVAAALALHSWLGGSLPAAEERNALDPPVETLPAPASASASTEDGAHAPAEPQKPDVASQRAALDAPEDPRLRQEPR